MSYQVGDLVRVTGTFTNAAGAAVDPNAVFAQYRDPSGSVTLLEYGADVALNKASAGVYYVDIDADEAGLWNYRFYSTGTGQANNPRGEFVVFVGTFT